MRESDTTLIFQERGSWLDSTMTFRNTFRWTWDRAAGRVSLEHLRLGEGAPVLLLRLTPVLLDIHLCKEDAYHAQVTWDEHSIRVSWRVVGPRKNEEIECRYF